METKPNKEIKRITGLDMYRIIACMLVVINHCNSKVMIQVTPYSLAWFVTIGVFYVTKIAVPGFLMIAGYNLLHREDEWKTNWHRVRRILVVLVVFSTLYFVWKSAYSLAPFSFWNEDGSFIGIGTLIWRLFTAIITDGITDAYWYLYMYLGLVIVMPFLQKFVKAVNAQDIRIFLILSLVFCCILPTIGEFVPGLSLASDFVLPYVKTTGGCVTYLLIGHVFYTHMNDKDTGLKYSIWLPVIGFAVGFAMNMIISVLEYRFTGGESMLSVGMIEYFPLALESLSMFAFLLKIKYGHGFTKVVELVAPTTFGIYLLSDFMCVQTHGIYMALCPHMNRLFAVAIQDITVLVVTFIVVLILRKLSIVRRYL